MRFVNICGDGASTVNRPKEVDALIDDKEGKIFVMCDNDTTGIDIVIADNEGDAKRVFDAIRESIETSPKALQGMIDSGELELIDGDCSLWLDPDDDRRMGVGSAEYDTIDMETHDTWADWKRENAGLWWDE